MRNSEKRYNLNVVERSGDQFLHGVLGILVNWKSDSVNVSRTNSTDDFSGFSLKIRIKTNYDFNIVLISIVLVQ